MKPIVHYIADMKVPIDSTLNISIVRKKISKTNYVNWINKSELTTFIDTLYIPPTSDCYMCVTCQCGTDFSYSIKQEIPTHNVTCTCGRKVLEYGN